MMLNWKLLPPSENDDNLVIVRFSSPAPRYLQLTGKSSQKWFYGVTDLAFPMSVLLKI